MGDPCMGMDNRSLQGGYQQVHAWVVGFPKGFGGRFGGGYHVFQG